METAVDDPTATLAPMAKLYFYYASMNAGKSTTLLQADFNYRERGMKTMLFTAAIDDRFAAGTITSRIGLEPTRPPLRRRDRHRRDRRATHAQKPSPACWSTRRSS